MSKLRSIQIDFPCDVEFPAGFERTLISLVNMICEVYEEKNPYRSMWVAGMGSRPNMAAIYADDHKNMFDDSIYHLEVMEREAHDRALEQRGYKLCDTTCPECGWRQFHPKPLEVSDDDPTGYVTCPNKHVREADDSQGNPIKRVHILNEGRPLCDFSHEPFEKWPDHEKFVTTTQTGFEEYVTCRKCKKEHRRLSSEIPPTN